MSPAPYSNRITPHDPARRCPRPPQGGAGQAAHRSDPGPARDRPAEIDLRAGQLAHLRPDLLRPRTRVEVALPGAHASAERDPARLWQGRHPGRVAGDHRHQRLRDAHRRLRRQPWRRAGRRHRRLHRQLQGHRHRVERRVRGAVLRPGLRRRARHRGAYRAPEPDARRGGDAAGRQHLFGARDDAHSDPLRLSHRRRARRADLVGDRRGAGARRRDQRHRRGRDPVDHHPHQRRRLDRRVRRRRGGPLGGRHGRDHRRHRLDHCSVAPVPARSATRGSGALPARSCWAPSPRSTRS